MKRKSAAIARLRGTFVPKPEPLLKSRALAALKRNPDVHVSYIIPVLSNAFTILDLLERAEGPMNTQQVAKITGYPLTTVYRILRTFSAYGYLPDGDDGVCKFRSSADATNISETHHDDVVPAS